MTFDVASPEDADQRDIFEKNAVGGYLRNRSAGKPDDEQPPLGGDASGREVEDLTPDRIVNDVGAAPARQRTSNSCRPRFWMVIDTSSPADR